MPEPKENRYKALLEKIFFDAYQEGGTYFEFEREDLPRAAEELGIKLPKNLGDVIYSIRHRIPLTEKVLATQPEGKEWIIVGVARARYAFKLVTFSRVIPRPDLVATKIPDATPEIIAAYAMNDEQALLAIMRYNRLIDIFLGLTTYSLQNHLRTTVKNGSQIEIDEVYIGLDRRGCHYAIPVQAKGGSDQIGVVQTQQDIQCCVEKFPGIACRPISAQFMEDGVIAMFELTIEDDELKVVEERHYKMVPADQLEEQAIRNYR